MYLLIRWIWQQWHWSYLCAVYLQDPTPSSPKFWDMFSPCFSCLFAPTQHPVSFSSFPRHQHHLHSHPPYLLALQQIFERNSDSKQGQLQESWWRWRRGRWTGLPPCLPPNPRGSRCGCRGWQGWQGWQKTSTTASKSSGRSSGSRDPPASWTSGTSWSMSWRGHAGPFWQLLTSQGAAGFCPCPGRWGWRQWWMKVGERQRSWREERRQCRRMQIPSQQQCRELACQSLPEQKWEGEGNSEGRWPQCRPCSQCTSGLSDKKTNLSGPVSRHPYAVQTLEQCGRRLSLSWTPRRPPDRNIAYYIQIKLLEFGIPTPAPI